MALLKSTKQRLGKLIDSAATLQLASEIAANRLTERVLDKATTTLVARVSVHGLENKNAAWSAVARNMRQIQEQVELEFRAAMLEARAIGREFAMRQVAIEAEPLVQTAEHALVLTPTLPAAEVEAMWVQQAGVSMARQFGASTIAELSRWSAANETTSRLPGKLNRVREAIEPERKKHAVTQSVQAFNEAKRDKWAELKEGRAKTLPGIPGTGAGKGGSGRGHAFDNSVREIWSAILDTRTCPICWKLDGAMVRVGEDFPEGAKSPLHAHCRCEVITAVIPDELERYLPGAALDYDALKDDIKDYMGSRKFDVGEGVRHAKRYVDDVLAKRGHSPVVLTERVNNRRAYFPNIVQAKAPTLRF